MGTRADPLGDACAHFGTSTLSHYDTICRMQSGRNIIASLQRWTYLVPLAVAYTIGLITWQHWPYFLVMLILSFGPAIIGCADPVGELVDYVGRERRRRQQALSRRAIVAQHAVGFLRQIQHQDADELRLMAQCLIRARNGFNRDSADPMTIKLLERGLVVAEPGFTPAGFPFYFTDRAWVLMNELRDEVFAAHDRIGDIILTPAVPPRRRFHLGWFIHDLTFLVLKGPVLLIILLPMAGVAWFAWIGAMAAVILAMVSAGYAVGWLLGF